MQRTTSYPNLTNEHTKSRNVCPIANRLKTRYDTERRADMTESTFRSNAPPQPHSTINTPLKAGHPQGCPLGVACCVILRRDDAESVVRITRQKLAFKNTAYRLDGN